MVIGSIFQSRLQMENTPYEPDNDHSRINEVLSYGDERDWFELYNPTPQRIDLDNASGKKTIPSAMFLTGTISLSRIPIES